ncbi:MAG: alanine--glyoxylate aminotransferase family protein [Deltaproteobacteria bacterium]|nr:alanine--glyoxylate aminotransferase family protein [Deltaproteobacteria bacterium]
MKNLLDSLHEVLLMGPGPSCIPEAVYQALSRPTIGHLDPLFIEIMDEIKQLLRQVMQTGNRLTIPISGTGSAGMETCFVNLIEPGDEVLILINGVFGKRMQDLATRLGARVDTLEFEWGTPVVVEQVKKQLEKKDYAIVAVVHAETSTGVRNPVEKIAELVEDSASLYLVDAVTSLGGIPVETDAWQVDALYSGTQKCLSCPPGLAPITFSERAIEKTLKRKTKVPNWYLDLSMIINYWEGNTRAYHHTAPVNMLYGLYQALLCITDEGFENVFDRHRACHLELVKSLEQRGMDMLVDPEYQLPMLNAVKIPQGVDEALIRRRLLEEHRIEIGAGLGPLAGKIWRIGLMGHTARSANIRHLAEALDDVILKGLGTG